MEWQPIETAPTDGTRILVSLNGGKQTVVRSHRGAWTIYYVDDRNWMRWNTAQHVNWLVLKDDTITGWMPLPEPPHALPSS